MDVEQRIGRIHRYGQNHTAQVYNLVLSDTIEGRVFLLLDEKLDFLAPACAPKWSLQERQELFSRVVEPALQRELRHKGTATDDGGFSAELIGYVEIVASTH